MLVAAEAVLGKDKADSEIAEMLTMQPAPASALCFLRPHRARYNRHEKRGHAMRVLRSGTLPREPVTTLRGKCRRCGCVVECGEVEATESRLVCCPTPGCGRSIDVAVNEPIGLRVSRVALRFAPLAVAVGAIVAVLVRQAP